MRALLFRCSHRASSLPQRRIVSKGLGHCLFLLLHARSAQRSIVAPVVRQKPLLYPSLEKLPGDKMDISSQQVLVEGK